MTSAVDLGEVYAAHRLHLVRIAILLVDDLASAEDVVQDAFAALAAKPQRLRDPHAAVAYLRTAVVNGSRSALRRRRQRGTRTSSRPWMHSMCSSRPGPIESPSSWRGVSA